MPEFHLRPLPGGGALKHFIAACSKALPNVQFQPLVVDTNVAVPHATAPAGRPNTWAAATAELQKSLDQSSLYKKRISPA